MYLGHEHSCTGGPVILLRQSNQEMASDFPECLELAKELNAPSDHLVST